MMKPRPVAVGAFLLAALALLVGGILFFTAGTLTAKHLRTVSFFPGTVAGLQVGSTVTFQGVPVGQVTSLGVRVTQDVRRPIIQVEMELVPSRVAVYGSPSLREDGDLVDAIAPIERLPKWLLCVPIGLQLAWLGLKYRSITLPSVLNPGIENGGLVGESKFRGAPRREHVVEIVEVAALPLMPRPLSRLLSWRSIVRPKDCGLPVLRLDRLCP
jgi:hypothetical protein